MKVAVYSITRDRLAYSLECFQSLRDKAGHPFDHYIYDNGSQDGTVEWLKDEAGAGRLKYLNLAPDNRGISRASNHLLDAIYQRGPYDLVIKADNDCLVESENILGQFVEIYEAMQLFDPQWILSPRVEGIANQPSRARYTNLGGRRVGVVGIVGGLFHVVPWPVYFRYRYPENLPLAKGQDDHFCAWAMCHGARLGYVEGLIVHHHETTDGQAKRFPDYFKRKNEEEQHAPETT